MLVKIDNEEIALTSMEYKILKLLMENSGRYLLKEKSLNLFGKKNILKMTIIWYI